MCLEQINGKYQRRKELSKTRFLKENHTFPKLTPKKQGSYQKKHILLRHQPIKNIPVCQK